MIGSLQKRRSQARKFDSPPDLKEPMYKKLPGPGVPPQHSRLSTLNFTGCSVFQQHQLIPSSPTTGSFQPQPTKGALSCSPELSNSSPNQARISNSLTPSTTKYCRS